MQKLKDLAIGGKSGQGESASDAPNNTSEHCLRNGFSIPVTDDAPKSVAQRLGCCWPLYVYGNSLCLPDFLESTSLGADNNAGATRGGRSLDLEQCCTFY